VSGGLLVLLAWCSGLLLAFASSGGGAVRTASAGGSDACGQRESGLFAIAHNVKGERVFMCVGGRWFSVKWSLRIAESHNASDRS